VTTSEPGLSTVEGWAWQESWDRQQEAYMPDREQRFAAMLDAVEAVGADLGRLPRVLDLAGGTGSISVRLLRRRPDAEVTMVDLDPVLMHIARVTLPDDVTVLTVDLRDPDWVQALPRTGFGAVLTATAMHWLTADRLAALYREIHHLLVPGGILINADHMPDGGLPTLSSALSTLGKRRRITQYATGAAHTWPGWWELVAADPALGPLKAQRDKLFSIDHAQEWLPAVGWHLDALRDAGFAETGVLWRCGTDAAVAARRATGHQIRETG
jgi:SAM-dependent methyltransferase